jgi:hypothetical protein
LDPSGDKAGHNSARSAAIADPIYQPPPKSNSEGDREVFMVRQGEELPEKTIEEFQWEAEEENARATHLAKEAEKGKRHNGLQDNTESLDGEPRNGTPLRRQHPKFNS